jgi:hypothetical protein
MAPNIPCLGIIAFTSGNVPNYTLQWSLDSKCGRHDQLLGFNLLLMATTKRRAIFCYTKPTNMQPDYLLQGWAKWTCLYFIKAHMFHWWHIPCQWWCLTWSFWTRYNEEQYKQSSTSLGWVSPSLIGLHWDQRTYAVWL